MALSYFFAQKEQNFERIKSKTQHEKIRTKPVTFAKSALFSQLILVLILYIVKRLVLCLAILLTMFRLGTGVWKEIKEIRVTQQYEIHENFSHASELFIVKNSVLDLSLGVGKADYFIDKVRKEGNKSERRTTYTKERRWILLFPLAEKTPSEDLIIQAWIIKVTDNEREIEGIKKRMYEMWSSHEIVETTHSRVQDALDFQMIPLRTIRRTIASFARSNQDIKRTKKEIYAANTAKRQICTQEFKNGLQCPVSAPILFHGRRHNRFFGLGFYMWLTLILSIFTTGILIKRTRYSIK